MKSLILKKPHA